MFACAVWVDSEHAKIFKIDNDGSHKSEIHTKDTDNATDFGHGIHKKISENTFFKKLLSEVRDTEELVLFGPGVSHVQFKHYIENHKHPIKLKIIGDESMKESSDNQILERASKYFKKYNTYHVEVDSDSV
jgi:stalled ribosome rescue protein Dom34